MLFSWFGDICSWWVFWVRDNTRKLKNGRLSQSGSDMLEGRKHRPDLWMAIVCGVLVLFGMIVMYSISPAISAITGDAPNFFIIRHIVAFVIGLLAVVAVYNIPLNKFRGTGVVFAIISLLSSILIVAISGFAFRWIKIAGFSFQPAELMKFGLIISLAFFLAGKKSSGVIKDFTKTLKPVLIALSALGLVVVIVQRDLGSMVVLASICVAMLFVANVPLRPILLMLTAFVVLGGIAVASTPYRRDRFETFMNPERDCQNQGYHACQALIAVGSGGLVGLGVGKSVQAYGYLPETPTDSIFAVYAEKFGFLGSVLIIGLIGILVMKLLKIASRTSSWEARLVVIGMATWIGVQASINIGAMLGLLPLKGITLPFVSYGGSSLIFVMVGIGVALRISCYTSARRFDIDNTLEGKNESSTIGRRDRRSYNAAYSGR
jgi:cell division protein FtsW